MKKAELESKAEDRLDAVRFKLDTVISCFWNKHRTKDNLSMVLEFLDEIEEYLDQI